VRTGRQGTQRQASHAILVQRPVAQRTGSIEEGHSATRHHRAGDCRRERNNTLQHDGASTERQRCLGRLRRDGQRAVDQRNAVV